MNADQIQVLPGRLYVAPLGTPPPGESFRRRWWSRVGPWRRRRTIGSRWVEIGYTTDEPFKFTFKEPAP